MFGAGKMGPLVLVRTNETKRCVSHTAGYGSCTRDRFKGRFGRTANDRHVGATPTFEKFSLVQQNVFHLAMQARKDGILFSWNRGRPWPRPLPRPCFVDKRILEEFQSFFAFQPSQPFQVPRNANFYQPRRAFAERKFLTCHSRGQLGPSSEICAFMVRGIRKSCAEKPFRNSPVRYFGFNVQIERTCGPKLFSTKPEVSLTLSRADQQKGSDGERGVHLSGLTSSSPQKYFNSLFHKKKSCTRVSSSELRLLQQRLKFS